MWPSLSCVALISNLDQISQEDTLERLCSTQFVKLTAKIEPSMLQSTIIYIRIQQVPTRFGIQTFNG